MVGKRKAGERLDQDSIKTEIFNVEGRMGTLRVEVAAIQKTFRVKVFDSSEEIGIATLTEEQHARLQKGELGADELLGVTQMQALERKFPSGTEVQWVVTKDIPEITNAKVKGMLGEHQVILDVGGRERIEVPQDMWISGFTGTEDDLSLLKSLDGREVGIVDGDGLAQGILTGAVRNAESGKWFARVKRPKVLADQLVPIGDLRISTVVPRKGQIVEIRHPIETLARGTVQSFTRDKTGINLFVGVPGGGIESIPASVAEKTPRRFVKSGDVVKLSDSDDSWHVQYLYRGVRGKVTVHLARFTGGEVVSRDVVEDDILQSETGHYDTELKAAKEGDLVLLANDKEKNFYIVKELRGTNAILGDIADSSNQKNVSLESLIVVGDSAQSSAAVNAYREMLEIKKNAPNASAEQILTIYKNRQGSREFDRAMKKEEEMRKKNGGTVI